MDYKEVETLAQQVAFFLNAGEKTEAWKFKPNAEPYCTQHIKGPDEAELYLNLGQYGADKGKVTVSGSLHIGKNRSYWTVYEKNTRVSVPSISVTVTRGAEVVAKEIKRRLLPEYLRILNLAVTQRDSQIAHENKRRNNLVALAKLVNARIPEADDASSTSFYRSDAAYGTINAYGDGGAGLELRNLTLEQARHILKYIANGNDEVRGALNDVVEEFAVYHQYDTAGRPWLENALNVLHPESDEHRAGCTHCQYVHDLKLPNA